jgi:hypothetical protein
MWGTSTQIGRHVVPFGTLILPTISAMPYDKYDSKPPCLKMKSH